MEQSNYWKLHVNKILEEEDYTYYENEKNYDFDEEALHNMDTEIVGITSAVDLKLHKIPDKF